MLIYVGLTHLGGGLVNSRERVLKALRHEEADRVPIDLDGMAASGIATMAYNRLKDY